LFRISLFGFRICFVMNYWVTIYKTAWIVAIVLVTVTTIWLFVPKIQQYRESYRKRAEYKEENRQLGAEVKQFRDKQERFTTDPSFVERTAREMGMVKPNEIKFKYTNDESRVESRQEQP
jgi:cell division protein FtsB